MKATIFMTLLLALFAPRSWGASDTQLVSSTQPVVVSTQPSTSGQAAAKVLTPAAGATVSGMVNITASATGSDIGCVAYTLDGSGYLAAVTCTPPYTLAWDTTKTANGQHTLTAGVWRQSNRAWLVNSPAITLTIANKSAPPPVVVSTKPVAVPATVTVLTPKAGKVSGTVKITASAVGDDVGCVGYTLDGSGYLDAALCTPPYTLEWDTTKTANGQHKLTAGVWRKSNRAWLAGSLPVQLTIANKKAPTPVIPKVTLPSKADSAIKSARPTLAQLRKNMEAIAEDSAAVAADRRKLANDEAAERALEEKMPADAEADAKNKSTRLTDADVTQLQALLKVIQTDLATLNRDLTAEAAAKKKLKP